eukprot:IDg20961t1
MTSNGTIPHELASMRISSVIYRKPGLGRGHSGTWVLNLINSQNEAETHLVKLREAKTLLEPAIVKWCSTYPGLAFDEDLALRWEIFESTSSSTRTSTSKPPTIERIILGDGKVHDGRVLVNQK